MTATLDLVSNQALSLPENERMALAHRLLKSVDEEPATDIDAAWAAEAIRRMEMYHAGEMDVIPAEEVFAAMRARAKNS